MEKFKFEIITPEKVLFAQDVEQAVVPCANGQMTILPNHAPIISLVVSGLVKLIAPQLDETFIIYGGYLQVAGNVATLLVDQAELRSQLDMGSLDSKIEQAREVLSNEGTIHAKNKHEDIFYQLSTLKQSLNY